MPKKSVFPDDRTFVMLSDKELRQRKRLSIDDQAAIIQLEAAIAHLSPFICLSVDEDGLIIQKRVTNGYAHCVKKIRKKSLCFDNRV